MAIKDRTKCGVCGKTSEHMYAAVTRRVDENDNIIEPDAYAVCGEHFTQQYEKKFGVKPEGVVLDAPATATPSIAPKS